MDVARDLVDRQLAGPEGDECGRIDDLWLEWNADGAWLGALESGIAIVLDQLGGPGRLLQRIGGSRARRSRSIEWSDVDRVDRTQVVLARVPPDAGTTRSHGSSRQRFSTLARLAVVDADGERRSVLDIRSETGAGGGAPRVLGLIACRHTWLRTLGMKRYDASGVPLAEVESHARWIPWSAVSEIGDEIRLGRAFDDLPRLAAAPDPGPPPWPQSQQAKP